MLAIFPVVTLNISEIRISIQTFLFLATTSLHGISYASGDEITLNFNWPDRLVGTTQYEASFMDIDEEENANHFTVATTEFSFIKKNDHFHVQHIVEKSQYNSNLEDKALGDFLALLATTTPSYTVSMSGEYGELVQFSKLKESLATAEHEWLQEMGMGSLPTNVHVRILDILKDTSLEEKARNDWHRIVGQWSGVTFKIGQAIETRHSLNFILFDELEFPAITLIKLLGYIDCNAQAGHSKNHSVAPGADANSRCVELEISTQLEKAPAVAFGKELLAKADNAQDVTLEPKANYVLNLITHPDTLIPHSFNESGNYVLEVDGFPLVLEQDSLAIDYQYNN